MCWPDLWRTILDSSAGVHALMKILCEYLLAGSQRRVHAATSLTQLVDGSVSLGVCKSLIFNGVARTEICMRSHLSLSVSFVRKEVMKLSFVVHKLGRMDGCLYASYCRTEGFAVKLQLSWVYCQSHNFNKSFSSTYIVNKRNIHMKQICNSL